MADKSGLASAFILSLKIDIEYRSKLVEIWQSESFAYSIEQQRSMAVISQKILNYLDTKNGV